MAGKYAIEAVFSLVDGVSKNVSKITDTVM